MRKKIALLKTYNHEGNVDSSRFVRVSPEWHQYMGSYCDEIPFAVGSNQAVVEIEESEIIFLWFMTIYTKVVDCMDGKPQFFRVLCQTAQGDAAFLSEEEARLAVKSIRENVNKEDRRRIYGERFATLRADRIPCYASGDPMWHCEGVETSEHALAHDK